MTVEYNSEFINELEISSSGWTPSDEDYVKLINFFANFIIKDDCYWGWRNSDKIENIFNDDVFGFVWNKFPNMRPSIIGVITGDFKNRPICSSDLRSDILNSLKDLIPRNLNKEDDSLRRAVIKNMCPFPFLKTV